MKKFIITSIMVGLFANSTAIIAQDQKDDYLGLPGDNLNLYAVMKLFQESKTLEEFEKTLNDENSRINNLDLNGDNLIDYLMVIDNVDGNVHNIILRDAISQRESQDVAVFTVQRFANGQVQIQLTGDEELYGKNYIIEPIFDDSGTGQTPNPGYTGNTSTIDGRNVTVSRTTTVEIATWPLIRFIFLPNYVLWHSSWYWGYYPSYWHPWHPFYWHYYYGYHYNRYNDCYGHYRRWQNQRYTRWNDSYYNNIRLHSVGVSERIHAGNYRNTYSHPEQKKDGESMYARMHHDQNTRRPDNSTGNRQARRSDPVSNRDRQATGTRNTTTRRSSTTVTNKSVTNPPPLKKTGTARRPDTKVTNRSNTVQPSKQEAGTNRTSVQSKKTGVSTSARKSSKGSKSQKAGKKDRKTKESEIKKDSSRN